MGLVTGTRHRPNVPLVYCGAAITAAAPGPSAARIIARAFVKQTFITACLPSACLIVVEGKVSPAASRPAIF